MIKHLRSYLPTNVLDQIYKMHVRSHFDYCDFIYHIPRLKVKRNPVSDSENDYYDDDVDDDDPRDHHLGDKINDIKLNYQMRAIESIQYQAALAVTGAWKGTNTSKIYEELGWESLHHRRWYRRATQFFKIMNGLTPQYLVDPIPVPRRHLFGRHTTNDLYEFSYRNQRFLNSFYPDSVICWNNLGPEIRNIETLSSFKKKLLSTIQPIPRSIFKIHDPNGVKILYQLRVGLSPLREHKKHHNFLDTPSDICHCGTGIETTEHFLLKCPMFSNPRGDLLSTINPIINSKIQNVQFIDDPTLVQIMLYGNENLNPLDNNFVLNATINYIYSTERFSL